LIGIVASTGGPQALTEILGRLPGAFSVPIMVVQSIHPDCLTQLVTRLGANCLLRVSAALDGQVPLPGTVYVASEDSGLLIIHGRLRLKRGDRGSGHEPRNALFRSMAHELGNAALAVILTGIGADGALGMDEIREAGGYTIVQDRPTSVIYGTARVAVGRSAACESLPIQEIAPRLVELTATGGPGSR
jgi:two-component system chemotaxis response regulator CheB